MKGTCFNFFLTEKQAVLKHLIDCHFTKKPPLFVIFSLKRLAEIPVKYSRGLGF